MHSGTGLDKATKALASELDTGERDLSGPS